MQRHNPFTHPHEEAAQEEAIRATDGMPTPGFDGHTFRPAPPWFVIPDARRRDSSMADTTDAEFLLVKEELRDHDFPIPPSAEAGISQHVAERTEEAPPETVRSGGKYGRKKGDRQRNAEVPTVMDQVMSEPLPLPDK